MGDSDEDYDRRSGRRDKFRGERNDYDNRRPPPSRGYDRGRGDRNWNNDRGSKRDYYGNNDRDRREKSFGRGSSPPSKRSKRDWEGGDTQWRSGGQDSNAMLPSDKGSGHGSSPSLMSFKDFIMQQEDDINETEAVRRYQEYKVEFKRTQINDFFVMHKAEEWFEEKYHPVKSVARKAFVRHGIKKRLRVFLDLWEAGYIDNLNLQLKNNNAVLKLVDQVVIKMEDGSDEDIKSLDFPPKKIEPEKKKEEDAGGDKESEEEIKKEPEEKANYTYDADTADDDENEAKDKEPLPPGMDEDDEDLKPPGMETEEENEEKVKIEEIKEDEELDAKEEPEKEKVVPPPYIYDGNWPKRPNSIFVRNVISAITRDDLVNVCKRYPGYMRVGLSEAAPERRYSRRGWVTFTCDTNIKDVCWNLSNIRVKEMELSPQINRDVNNRIRPINGIACSPMAMQLDINFAIKLVKKLDAKLRLYEREETNGYGEEDKENEENEDEKETEEKEDDDDDDRENKEKEIEEGEENNKEVKKEPKKEIIELPDTNPVFEKLPDQIEELITGLELGDEEDDKKDYPIVVNEELRQWLDLVLMYLRVVHSVDYYNAIEYHNEDEMPVRCGIIHVRAEPLEATSKKDVHEYFNVNASKLESVKLDVKPASDEEADRFGKKDEEIEVENFIKANTQELAKDKWLCPLSGKKFRGPEFVRKHILMKHKDNVDNVRAEVKFFNNYIYDLNRPCFPEAKPKIGESTGQRSGSNTTWQARQPVVFAAPKSNYSSGYTPSTPQPPSMPQETYGRMNTFPPKQIRRGGGNFRDRKPIKYRDLDAPEESDFF